MVTGLIVVNVVGGAVLLQLDLSAVCGPQPVFPLLLPGRSVHVLSGGRRDDTGFFDSKLVHLSTCFGPDEPGDGTEVVVVGADEDPEHGGLGAAPLHILGGLRVGLHLYWRLTPRIRFRGARGLVLLLLLILVVALPASLSPRLPVTVRVLRLQHIDGGGAGPAAVVGKPASPAAPGALRGGLDPLGGEGRSELLRSLLQQQERRHQSQVLQLILAEEEGKDWVSMLVRLISICFSQAVTSKDNHLPICFPWFEDLRKINMASTNSGKTVLY